MPKAKRGQSRPLPKPPYPAHYPAPAAEPTQDEDPENWLAAQLERVQTVLAIPYPATSREIRLRAVHARVLIAQIAATLPQLYPENEETHGENSCPADVL